MILKKTYNFVGTVKSAKGLWRKKVIGKPVKGIVTVTGQVEDFGVVINRVFKVGGKITEAPLMSMFPGSDVQSKDYPYVIRTLGVLETIVTKTAKVDLALTIVPWTRLDAIKAVGYSKAWLYSWFISEVEVVGVADLIKSEESPDPAKKR